MRTGKPEVFKSKDPTAKTQTEKQADQKEIKMRKTNREIREKILLETADRYKLKLSDLSEIASGVFDSLWAGYTNRGTNRWSKPFKTVRSPKKQCEWVEFAAEAYINRDKTLDNYNPYGAVDMPLPFNVRVGIVLVIDLIEAEAEERDPIPYREAWDKERKVMFEEAFCVEEDPYS